VPPVFGSPTSVGSLNTAGSEIDPVLSPDGLTLYYVAYRSALQGNDIYRATRAKAKDRFGAGTPYDEVSSTFNDTHFFVGPDNLEAFIASDRPVNYGSTDIFRATRTTTTDAWATFTSSATVNSNSAEFNPHLESHQLTLWFDATDRLDGAGQQDIFYTTRAAPLTGFGSPTPATELDSIGNERDASLTDDGLVILFQSDRDGAFRVYFATRASRNAPFGSPVIVTSLDPYMGSLIDPFISPDGCSIYFAADLPGGAGSMDIYRVDAL
jgi:Tol biopolymer transport system component